MSFDLSVGNIATAAGGALSIGSQLLQYSQQQQLAEYNNAQTIASARQAYLAENQALTARAEEVNATTAEQSVDLARNALIAKARVRAATGESGLTGYGRLNRAQAAAAGTDLARLEGQRRRTQRQIGRQRAATKATYKARTSNLQRGPSLLGTGLSIGATLAKTASSIYAKP